MNSFVKGLVIGCAPLIAFIISITIISGSKQPNVKYIKEVVRPGYQTEPAKYIVEASYAKYWHDSRKPVLIIIAYLLVIFGSAYICYITEENEIKNGYYLLIPCWLLGAILIFAPMAIKTYGSSSYESTLTVQEYEQSKNNIDSLFPYIESTPK